MTGEMDTRLDLKKLLAACVHLSRVAGRVIRQTHEEGQLGAHNKKDGSDKKEVRLMEASEVLTIADLRAQHVIVANMRALFPGIRLVGEEDEADSKDEAGRLGKMPAISLADVPLLAPFEVPHALAESVTLADTCLWIDPLDGTIEFVRGNLHHVCVLIGIAVKDRPVAGVVLQPFLTDEHSDGVATYGAVGLGVFSDRSAAFGDPPAVLTPAVQEKCARDPRVAAGVARLRRAGAAEPVISQAAGQNLLKVLRGQTSCFLQRPGASRWDTCAAEALLVSVGGKVTDLDGEAYLYVEGASSYANAGGLVAARTEALHAQALAAVREEAGEPAVKRPRAN